MNIRNIMKKSNDFPFCQVAASVTYLSIGKTKSLGHCNQRALGILNAGLGSSANRARFAQVPSIYIGLDITMWAGADNESGLNGVVTLVHIG